MCHPPGHVLVHTNRAQDDVHLALHLAVTRAFHARLGRTAEITIVIALCLRCEEAADAHRNCACDELGDATEDDESGLAEGRETCGESEWDGEAV